jgi:hypothetical protein
MQMLVVPKQQELKPPKISVRSKGAVGKLEDRVREKSVVEQILQYAVSITVAVAVGSVLLISTIKKDFSKLPISPSEPSTHAGDQRDVFGYLLGQNGFGGEAELVRKWSRQWSYWSISDFLVERWLSAQRNVEILKRGIAVFENLLEYAQIAPESARIVHLNAARLANALGDVGLAKIHISGATSQKDKVIDARLHLEPDLKKYSNPG